MSGYNIHELNRIVSSDGSSGILACELRFGFRSSSSDGVEGLVSLISKIDSLPEGYQKVVWGLLGKNFNGRKYGRVYDEKKSSTPSSQVYLHN